MSFGLLLLSVMYLHVITTLWTGVWVKAEQSDDTWLGSDRMDKISNGRVEFGRVEIRLCTGTHLTLAVASRASYNVFPVFPLYFT